MNSSQIECFISVAQHLNFAKAAEELNISQPAVSHQVRTLEDELGVKLFYRSTRSVELTDEGMSFLDDAKSIAMIARRAVSRFASPGEDGIQSLSLGYSGCLKSNLLAQVFASLIKKHGAFTPEVSEISPQRMAARLEEGAIDAYLGIKTEDAQSAAIKFRSLSETQLMCLCREDHPLTFAEEITTDTLKKHRLIVCGNPPAGRGVKIRWLLTRERGAADVIFCPSAETAVLFAQSGFGAAILPDAYIPDSSHLTKLKITDISPLEYGIYIRSGEENILITDLVKEIKNKIKYL